MSCKCGRYSYSVPRSCDNVVCWKCLDERALRIKNNRSENGKASTEIVDLARQARQDLKKNVDAVKRVKIAKQSTAEKKKPEKIKTKTPHQHVNPVDPITGKRKRGRPKGSKNKKK